MSLFIAFEGLDGSGCETQSKLLKEFLEKKNFGVEYFDYPKYTEPIGEMIKSFLHKKIAPPLDVVFLLFATDQLEDKEKILNSIDNGRFVITARYFTSNIAFQMSKGLPLEKILAFAETMEMPKPNLVFFLDIPPEIVAKRKTSEHGMLDVHESDLDLQRRVKKSYEKLVNEKIFAEDWITVKADRPIEEIAKEIQEIVLKKLENSNN